MKISSCVFHNMFSSNVNVFLNVAFGVGGVVENRLFIKRE